MPPHPDAVEAAGRTGHARYLELCDPDDPAYNPAYLSVVAAIARGEPIGVKPTGVTPAARSACEPLTRSWLDRVNTCPYRVCHDGCAATRCHAGRGDHYGNTSLENCRSCLRGV